MTKPQPMQHEYFECECYSDEHVLRFTYDPDENELYTSTFLRHWRPWYKRVWVAIRYVFGYKCKYGHFDSTIIAREEVPRLRDLFVRVADAYEGRNTADGSRKVDTRE